MTTAEQILVVFLSTALAVLLVLAIIVLAYAVRLIKKINNIADKIEHLANSAEAVGSAVRKTVADLRIVNLLRTVAEVVRGKSTKHKENKGG